MLTNCVDRNFGVDAVDSAVVVVRWDPPAEAHRATTNCFSDPLTVNSVLSTRKVFVLESSILLLVFDRLENSSFPFSCVLFQRCNYDDLAGNVPFSF